MTALPVFIFTISERFIYCVRSFPTMVSLCFAYRTASVWAFALGYRTLAECVYHTAAAILSTSPHWFPACLSSAAGNRLLQYTCMFVVLYLKDTHWHNTFHSLCPSLRLSQLLYLHYLQSITCIKALRSSGSGHDSPNLNIFKTKLKTQMFSCTLDQLVLCCTFISSVDYDSIYF